MDIVFLEASVSLTKSYSKSYDGTIVKTPYPMTWEFTSIAEQPANLNEFCTLLQRHAARGHCLLKGSIARPLVNESRAGSTNTNDPTQFVVLDLDGLPEDFTVLDANGIERKVPVTLDTFLQAVGLQDVSHIVQWSASYGIENKKLRAHLFFMLNKWMAAPLLKQWLIQLNHQVAMLNAAMTLTTTGNAISWALDISACQNDKLIYVAPPTLKGIKDPLGKTPRISLVKRKFDVLDISATINSHAKNRELTHKRLDQLRDAASLPKRKTAYKIHGQTEVMVKPDSCTITEMKQERGFVYFNLNGGDSWAYYHPETNPDYIYNFKGEPAYLTKELLPEYWEQLTQQGARANSSGKTFLAFCDRATGAYWRGTYDATTDALDLFVAKNETQVRHFAKQHGLPLGDFIPEWDLVFDPHDAVRVDFQNKTINKFALTKYMRAQTRPVAACPKTILKIIHHAVGGDPAITDFFINWLATILQKRDRTKTAWVLHGVPGTGKGILFNKIIRPIFGMKQTSSQNMQSLAEPYNHWMEGSFLIFVDEVQTKALLNEDSVTAKLKNYITEETIQLRAMHQGVHEVRNYTNWILASNMPDVVKIEAGDRRFNVGKYQKTKLVPTEKEMQLIEQELQTFHDFLLHYKIDELKASSIIDTTDRNTMISISQSSVDTVGSALLEGHFGFLMEQLPSSTTNLASQGLEQNKVLDYVEVLKALISRTDKNNGGCSIARDELKTIFNYVVGGMPTTPNKFTSLLKHHRIHITDVWINTGTSAGKERGIKVEFTDLAQFPAYSKILTPPQPVKKGVGVKKLTVIK